MTKSEQARRMYLDNPNLSRTEIAKSIGMYVSQVSQALKKLDSEKLFSIEDNYKSKPKGVDCLIEALDIYSAKQTKIWLASRASTQEWNRTFLDKDVCRIIFEEEWLKIQVSFSRLTKNYSLFETLSPFEFEDLLIEIPQIFKGIVEKRHIHIYNYNTYGMANINLQEIYMNL